MIELSRTVKHFFPDFFHQKKINPSTSNSALTLIRLRMTNKHTYLSLNIQHANFHGTREREKKIHNKNAGQGIKKPRE